MYKRQPYNDASEFEDLINKFKAIILNNGINLLNELSNIKEKPYVSMNKYKKLLLLYPSRKDSLIAF